MQLYIANKNYSSWSLRPWVLMQTLGIAFVETLKPFPMGGGATGFDSFSTSARVPVLLDEGTTVWDTLAITEYVAEQHAQVWPSDNSALQEPWIEPAHDAEVLANGRLLQDYRVHV